MELSKLLKNYKIANKIQIVLQEIDLRKSDTKAVPPVLQLAATLSLLASGGYQHSVGSDYLIGIGQSTVSKLCPQLIRFAPEDSLSCKEWFVEQNKIPGGKYRQLKLYFY